jgi:membrane protease YdiL (CAAX protease family)
MKVPRTAYLWLLLLVLSFVLPPLIKAVVPAARHAAVAAEAGLSTQDFEQYREAEAKARLAFAGELIPGVEANAVAERSKRRALRDAVTGYRKLAETTHAPNMARRVLILTNAQNKPFREQDVTALLIPNLKDAKRPQAEIDAEAALWRSVYGEKRVPSDRVPEAARRIRAMRLRFLQDLALADLYRAAGDTQTAERYTARLEAKATSYQNTQLATVVPMLFGALTGLVFLIVFAAAAARGNWPGVRRVPTAPLRLGWGDLLDAFLFYLAAFKGMGLLISLPLSIWAGDLPPRYRLGLIIVLEVGVWAAAAAYLWRTARRRGATLADLGWTTRGNLLGNIGYGIAGYLTAIPLVIVFGLISRLIFNHSTDTTPNPVIPLIAGERDPLARVLIFVLASICAPLIEEFFFRGVLYSGLRTRYPWVISAALSGLCFAVMHPIQDWLPIVALGFVLATLREMRQSLVPGVVAHFLQNTVTFIALTVLFRD